MNQESPLKHDLLFLGMCRRAETSWRKNVRKFQEEEEQEAAHEGSRSTEAISN